MDTLQEHHLPDNTNIWIKESDQSTLTIKMWFWGGGYRVQLTDISNDVNYSRCLDFDDGFYPTIQEAECRYNWLISLYKEYIVLLYHRTSYARITIQWITLTKG